MASGDSISRFSNMPDKAADYDQYWAYLSNAIEYILTDTTTELSFADYANITTVVFNYHIDNKARRMRAGLRARPTVLKPDLYNQISDYLVQHFQSLKEKSQSLQGVDLLRYYAAEWDSFTISTKRLNRLFAFVNRYWVKHERDEGRKYIHEVGTLALIQWKTHFFSYIQQENSKLTSAILGLIAQERDGEPIDRALVKKVVDSFVSLGLDDLHPNNECLDVYREQFENDFLQATESYYKAESDAYLAKNSVSDYLKRVEERLGEEDARIEHYLHATTREDLINKCEHTLIRAHSGSMEDSFQSLLDFEKHEDLQRMYIILSRVPDGLEPLRKRFEAHVKQAGLTAISNIVSEGGADAGSVDPKAYVDALLEVYSKHSEIVRRCFSGEAGFAASLDKSCREFINRNAATGASSAKSAELVAKHVDALLNESRAVTRDDIEGALQCTMIIVDYLENKDSVRNFISTHQ